MYPRNKNGLRGYQARAARRNQQKLLKRKNLVETPIIPNHTHTNGNNGLGRAIVTAAILLSVVCLVLGVGGLYLAFSAMNNASSISITEPGFNATNGADCPLPDGRIVAANTLHPDDSGWGCFDGEIAPVPAGFEALPAGTDTDNGIPSSASSNSCNSPKIEASLNGSSFTDQGEYLDTYLGKRVTFTNRKVVVPNKEWNEQLTAAELEAVETTWVQMHICVPEGHETRVFAGGFRQGDSVYNNGVFFTLTPGSYTFDMRNGEAVDWFPGQDEFEADDFDRIIQQIRTGNFDIHGPLGLAVTNDLLPLIPADLVQSRNISIVPNPDTD